MLKAVLGTALALAALLGLGLVYGSTFVELYRPAETLAAAGGTVFRDVYYLGEGKKLYRSYDPVQQRGKTVVYTAPAREAVSVLERHVDGKGRTQFYDVKTQAGLVGQGSPYSVRPEPEPHVALGARLVARPSDLPGRIVTGLVGLLRSFHPSYRHTRVYAAMAVLDPKTWRFAALALLALTALLAVSFGPAPRIPAPQLAQKARRFGLQFGAIAGMFTFWNLQSAAAYLAGPAAVLLWPKGLGFSIWVIWLTAVAGLLAVALLPFTEKLRWTHVLVVPLALVSGYLAGFLLLQGLFATVGWAFGQVAPFVSKAFHAILPFLVVVWFVWALLTGKSSSGGRAPAAARAAGGDAESQLARDQAFRRNQEEAASRRAARDAQEAAESARQRAYAAAEWERWKS